MSIVRLPIMRPEKPCARCGARPREKGSYCRPCENAMQNARKAARR